MKKKSIQWILVLVLFFLTITPLKNVNARSNELIIRAPFSGEVIHGFQLIRIATKGLKPSQATLVLSIIDARGARIDLPLESDDQLLYANLDTRNWADGTHYLIAWAKKDNQWIGDSEMISIVIDNRTPALDVSIQPSLTRSGNEISFFLKAQILIEEAYAEMENGVRVFLGYYEDQEIWKGTYLVPYVLNEGAHFVTINARDSSGKTLQSSTSFMVCNSEPFIIFPRNRMQVSRNFITVRGNYQAGSLVFLSVNGKWTGEAITQSNGEWSIENVKLETGNNELIVFSQQDQPYGPLFPYQTVNIELKENSLYVLSYHNIASSGNIYSRSVEDFERDLLYFIENDFNIVSPTLLLSYFDGKADLPQNPVLITFDDGYAGVYAKAYPLLQQYQISAIFFVLTSRVGVFRDFVTWEQLSEMQSARVFSIESHTHNSHFYVSEADGLHAALTSRIPLPDGTLESYDAYRQRIAHDLKKSKELIEMHINKKVHFLSVPFGSANREVNEISLDLGFKATFNSDGGINSLPLKPLNVKRITVKRDDKIEDIVY